MDLEAVLSLFDSCWFNLEILKKPSNPTLSNPTLSSNSPKKQDKKIQENSLETACLYSSLLDIQLGSQSDDLSYNPGSLSPDSVLLQTLFQTDPKKSEPKKVKSRRKERRRKTRTKKGLSKSLSELEYEELKGFMDLGFDFSEDDVNSSLVEIIPGLQKLGKKRESNDQEKVKNIEKYSESRSRPYLSEAWEVLEKEKRMNLLMNWKVPAMCNETDIKHSLKWWAHTVASTVKA